MPIKDYIISTLNLEPDDIETFDVVRKEDAFYTHLTVKDHHPCCPVCGAPARAKALLTLLSRPCRWTHSPTMSSGTGADTSARTQIVITHSARTTDSRLAPCIHPIHWWPRLPRISTIFISLTRTLPWRTMSAWHIEVYADSFLNVPRLHLPDNIGIDELCSDMAKYGNAYLCVMVDNNGRDLFEILPSRTKHELLNYFEKIPAEERNKVKYVTMDLWDPYRDVARRRLPNCLVCADGFHVIEELSRCFSGSVSISWTNTITEHLTITSWRLGMDFLRQTNTILIMSQGITASIRRSSIIGTCMKWSWR